MAWQRKLLNLTTSNRLLHLPDSAKAVRLLSADPGALEDLLAGGKRVRIAPLPDLDVGGRDEKLYQQQTQASLRDEVAEAAMKRGEVLSPLSKDKLDAALVDLYRKARADLEEGGANTLYLVELADPVKHEMAWCRCTDSRVQRHHSAGSGRRR